MIHEQIYFELSCDNCGEGFTDWDRGISATINPSTIIEYAENHGWISGSGFEGHKGKHYCDKCHKVSDEDELILIPNPKPEQK